jgi:hypothetical protein
MSHPLETGWWDELPDKAREETLSTFGQRRSCG